MCRRRNHQPLVIKAGILAYNEIQEHQQKKRNHALSVDRAMVEASLPSSTSNNSINDAPDPTPESSILSELPAESPPAYDSIDSPIHSKSADDYNEKAHPHHSTHPIQSSSLSPIPRTAQAATTTSAASYRVYTKLRRGTLQKVRLTPSDSCCNAYKIRYRNRDPAVVVRRSCATVGSAQIVAPGSVANVSLDTMNITRLERDGVGGWEIGLPRGGGGVGVFWWRGGKGSEVGGGLAGSAIWRLEDEEGGVVAVFMDDVRRWCGGRKREGVLNVVRGAEDQRMKDAVVTSCFVMLKLREGEGLVTKA